MGFFRLLLALAVVISHSTPIFGVSLVSGDIAVQAFYIISGFYMTLILNEKYVGTDGSYKLFISNRFLRLYPLYWVTLAATILFSVILFISSKGGNAGKLNYYAHHYKDLNIFTYIFLAFTNLFIFLQDMVMYLGINLSNGALYFTADYHTTTPQVNKFLLIPQAWTVGVELMYYLIAPFIVRRRLWIIGMVILASLSLRLFMYSQGLNHDPWTHRFFPNELVFFLFGTLSYHGYKYIQHKEISTWIPFAMLFIMTVYSFVFKFFPIGYELNKAIYFLLFAFFLPFIFKLTKSNKLDAQVGELSYPVYISHILVLTIITKLSLYPEGHLGLTLTIFTLIVSYLLNKYIAERIEVIRQNRVKGKVST